MLKISFISGKSVILNALEDTRSALEAYTGHSIYNVTYPLSKEAVDLMLEEMMLNYKKRGDYNFIIKITFLH